MLETRATDDEAPPLTPAAGGGLRGVSGGGLRDVSGGGLRSAWRAWLAAVQFLTRLPLPAAWLGGRPSDTEFRRSAVMFPLVGIMVGLISGAAIWLGETLWPPWIAAAAGLAVEALLTGALHEDALADFCDAFGGGWTRDDVLRILDDSRIGSFGALGLLLAVLLRAGSLASLEPPLLLAAAVAAAAAGRWAMLAAMALLPPVPGRESLARELGTQVTARDVLLGAAWLLAGIAPLVWLAPWRAVAAAVALAVLIAGLVAYVHRRIGGLTGDCLGTLCYAVQVCVALCAAAGAAT